MLALVLCASGASAEFVYDGSDGGSGGASGQSSNSSSRGSSERNDAAGFVRWPQPMGGAEGWSFEFDQAAWSAHPSQGLLGTVLVPVRPREWQAFGASGPVLVDGMLIEAYDLNASLWWNGAVGMVSSARVVDDRTAIGPQALLGDLCAAWRISQQESGAFEVLAGARVAAVARGAGVTADGGSSVGGSLVGDAESAAIPIVGVRMRSTLARGVRVALRAEVGASGAAADSTAGIGARRAGLDPEFGFGAGFELDLGRDWTMSLEARWRSLDRALIERIGSGPGAGGRSDEGALWIGLSKSF
ncbi:MAG: hypothetical protein RL136_1310 [Planctomycetota bacterium]